MQKHAVGNSSDIPVGSSLPVVVGDRTILVFHLSDGFYATQSQCTHLFMPLKRGKVIDDCKIQCPFHRARFDIRSGEVVDWASFPPGIQLLNAVRKEKALQTYAVTEEGGQLFVTL
jgi:3-phenylpropionate/trans-cinnamate dioxygenase ferredoxin subunit